MNTTGTTITGGLHGTHVPLPTGTRPLPQRARRTGLDWGAHTTGPDPDAIARLTRLGILTVTHETVEDKPVRVVRKVKPPKRKPGPAPGSVGYTPRFDVDKAVELYLSGLSVRAVAEQVGVAPASVRARLIQRGVQMRPASAGRRLPSRRHPVEDIAADYLAGAGTRALAAKYGAAKATIKRLLIEHGVTLRDDRGKVGNGIPLTAEEVAAIVELYQQGATCRQIAGQVRRGEKNVGRALREAGITMRRRGDYGNRDNASALRDLMVSSGVKAADVRAWAAETGLDCTRSGIPPKRLVEAYIEERKVTDAP